ncbi:MAG: hypothetical protein DRQ51_01150 [Gammaproteobacteria bacterium]|nr:MAG: hypothetical protein DRQ51_01150 [Gammaproteobacteria bacterium]
MKFWTFLLLIFFYSSAIFAGDITPNFAKEKRWSVAIEDSLMDGEVVWLKARKHSFLSILTASEKPSRKAVIIMHGIGVHPNMQQIIQPLRIELTKYGYHTLSMQMPVLANGIEAPEYLKLLTLADKRIKAAIDYLQQQKLEVDFVVAHSMGTVMASHFMANNPHPFKYFVGIGMPNFTVKYLSKIKIPTLDLYGTDDIKPVLDSVKKRQQAAKNNPKYQQIVVKTDHFFNDKNELLVKTVQQWMDNKK